MRVITRYQKSAEWFAAKVGRLSGSTIARAMKKLTRASGIKKSGDWAAEHDAIVRELAWELITRVPTEHYVSAAMDHGTTYEPEARVEYMLATGSEVEQTGFVLHPTLEFLGASPDGIIPPDGILEIKCPLLKTHQQYLINGCVPEEYIPQMQCEMLCCEAKWGDFVSYVPPEVYPEMPERFRLFVKRIYADPEIHRQMEEAAIVTMGEAAKLAQELADRYPEIVRSVSASDPVRQYATSDEAMQAAADLIDSLEGGMAP